MERKRTEEDMLGQGDVPHEAYYGLHTVRARYNFPLSGRRPQAALVRAYGKVKLAAAQMNAELGAWPQRDRYSAIITACEELAGGELYDQIVVDSLQGGAGTSLNMNVNEVIANRALEILGEKKGSYDIISPLDDINKHQSTNDTFPTALKIAAIELCSRLEGQVVALQEAFQQKEKEFSHIVKVGRTELQDAVLITLGREMSAYAEAFARDRWRIYKCVERLRVVNLGGTAIGTGVGAPKAYIFGVVEKLREVTGIGLARAENLVENTQNADVFVEVSGMLKALAVSLLKCCGDLRLLASGPEGGFAEIELPAVQAGSSLMPGKINPVIPEAVSQAAILSMSYENAVAMAAGLGNLELNQYMPLIAFALLEQISLLTQACDILSTKCVTGIKADEQRCLAAVHSSTAAATALVAVLGYKRVSEWAAQALSEKRSLRDVVVSSQTVSEEDYDRLITPEAVMRLGS